MGLQRIVRRNQIRELLRLKSVKKRRAGRIEAAKRDEIRQGRSDERARARSVRFQELLKTRTRARGR